MKANEVNIDRTLADVQQRDIHYLIENAQSIGEIITGWMRFREREIHFYQAIDDDRPEVEILGIQLLNDGRQHAEVYYLKETLTPADKNLVLVSSHIRGYKKNGSVILDEQAFDSWENSLGFSYSYALCSQIADQKALIPFVLSYVLSDGGEIAISNANRIDQELFEDMKEDLIEENINLERTLQIHANYHTREVHSGVIPGWGCQKYITLDSCYEN